MGKCDVKGSRQHNFCKGQSSLTGLVEVRGGGNKYVDKLDIMYLDFQIAFDSFSTKVTVDWRKGPFVI